MKSFDCVPSISVLHAVSRTASYIDCVTVDLPLECSQDPLDLYLALMRPVPRWLNGLLGVRDVLGRAVGIRPVGGFGEDGFPLGRTPGTRVDLFTIDHYSDTEMTLVILDSHLDVALSFLKMEVAGRFKLCLSTVVTTHNRVGTFYMLPVGPFHRRLVRYLLRRALQRFPSWGSSPT